MGLDAGEVAALTAQLYELAEQAQAAGADKKISLFEVLSLLQAVAALAVAIARDVAD